MTYMYLTYRSLALHQSDGEVKPMMKIEGYYDRLSSFFHLHAACLSHYKFISQTIVIVVVL